LGAIMGSIGSANKGASRIGATAVLGVGSAVSNGGGGSACGALFCTGVAVGIVAGVGGVGGVVGVVARPVLVAGFVASAGLLVPVALDASWGLRGFSLTDSPAQDA
jgi:hypothetical protein